jgi:EAL domain-containing protein (putative c-di-GMP-specific phosphodiesterase class I)
LEFLPVIEGHSLSVVLGEWVIHTALFQIELWENQKMSIPVSVNIGARQLLEDNFVDRLETILKEHPNVKPSMLEIEVLETSKIEDVTAASIIINKCKDLGVLFSLDDFGTGYSSLTYLKQLPVSKIKIDQSFVKDMLYNPDDLAILDGIIKLSDAFRRNVIAEGVETIDQGIILLQLGCELAQGYIIARPMKGELIPDWLQIWTPNDKWKNQSLMDHNQLQLLFAAIEHLAWIKNINSYVNGKSKILKIKNRNGCTFSSWFKKEGKRYFKTLKEYNEIKKFHELIHEIFNQIDELYQEDKLDEVSKCLEELDLLSDNLFKILNRYVFIPVV